MLAKFDSGFIKSLSKYLIDGSNVYSFLRKFWDPDSEFIKTPQFIIFLHFDPLNDFTPLLILCRQRSQNIHFSSMNQWPIVWKLTLLVLAWKGRVKVSENQTTGAPRTNLLSETGLLEVFRGRRSKWFLKKVWEIGLVQTVDQAR